MVSMVLSNVTSPPINLKLPFLLFNFSGSNFVVSLVEHVLCTKNIQDNCCVRAS